MTHEITPFELSLVHELDDEYIRMANGWFFKWHSINMTNRVVDVEDFFGGRFHVGGVVFQGQLQELYWRSVGKHLLDRVHSGFQRWESECATYPPHLKRCALAGLDTVLKRYIAQIMQKGVETDRALRGHGDPHSVPEYNSTGQHSRANVEILRLRQAHEALLPPVNDKPPKVSVIKRTEEHFTKWRGLYAGAGLLIAALGLAARFLL
jgi:hypothetical protein